MQSSIVVHRDIFSASAHCISSVVEIERVW